MGVDLSPLIDVSTEEQEAPTHNHYAHIVSPPENPVLFRLCQIAGIEDPSAQDIVDFARQRGATVKALCGALFVPLQDPESLEACQICFDVAGMHMRNAGE